MTEIQTEVGPYGVPDQFTRGCVNQPKIVFIFMAHIFIDMFSTNFLLTIGPLQLKVM